MYGNNPLFADHYSTELRKKVAIGAPSSSFCLTSLTPTVANLLTDRCQRDLRQGGVPKRNIEFVRRDDKFESDIAVTNGCFRPYGLHVSRVA